MHVPSILGIGIISSMTLLAPQVAAKLPVAGKAPASTATSDDEAWLEALQGRWFMVGTLDGRPVRYRAEGRRVLQGAFMRLRLTDAAPRSQYEAEVFLGFDPKHHDYIVHWLDRFGAAGARVIAEGEREGDQLVVTFPADEGDFRDTFTWHALSQTWSLLIESQAINGEWTTFASFILSRDSRR